MFNKFNLAILSCIFLLIILPFVSSAPPFATSTFSSTSLQIESPNIQVLKAGMEKRFHAHVINGTATKTNRTTTCALHVYNQTGWDLSIGSQWMEFESYNGIDFAHTVNGGNFTNSGIYAYVIQCNSSNEVGFYRGQFIVTPNGEVADTSTAVFDVGLLFILALILVGCVVLFMESNNLLAKVGMFGFGYLLLIAITFVSWNMANDFLTSSPFIISMFRIVFFVLIIGAFPLVIGAFAWYVLMLFKVKEIERLMTKGFSEGEARRRVK